MFRSIRLVLPLVVLLFASLACQAVMGGGSTPITPQPSVEQPEPDVPDATEPAPATQPAAVPTSTSPSGLGIQTEFPFPNDARDCMDLGSNGVMCQSGISLKDAAAFYRAEFAAKGYTERELLTLESDTVLSLVFDGHESGKAIVLQCVDLGTGSISIILRLEDM